MDGPACSKRYISHCHGYCRNSRRKIHTVLSQGLQVPDCALHLELTQQQKREKKSPICCAVICLLDSTSEVSASAFTTSSSRGGRSHEAETGAVLVLCRYL